MEHVESSNIEAISYLKAEKILKIHFKNGSVYEWKDVPVRKYNRLMEAESKGSFFSKEIKGKYTSNKLKSKDLMYNDIKDFFDI